MSWHCDELPPAGQSIATCIQRQFSMNGDGKFRYPVCQDCIEGEAVKRENPELVEAVTGTKKPVKPKPENKSRIKTEETTKQIDEIPGWGEFSDTGGSVENKFTSKTKTCKDCGKEYQPTSNVQKRCPECKEKLKAMLTKAGSRAKRVKRPAPHQERKQIAASGNGNVIETLKAQRDIFQRKADALTEAIEIMADR